MKTWQIVNKTKKDVIQILLENRGFKTQSEKQEFFKPTHPKDITLKELEISKIEINKAKKRIEEAKKKKEKVIVYGDYDADGITATAIMWEALYKFGLDVLPYIPDRFKEGYGINSKSVEKLKEENPELKLIVTVDNGIVAFDGIKTANKLGIDVIVTDHHQPDFAKASSGKAFAVIHTTKICGSALAWITSREIGIINGLELAAIGTIADQMPLTHANRSFAKYGLIELNKTKRVGIIALMEDAGIPLRQNLAGPAAYEVNYIIAPRINAMGRLANATDSLRLLCTKDKKRAKELAELVSNTNLERQKIVEKMIISTNKKMKDFTDSIIFLSDTNYHEGVIGLAAGRLVEEFYRPAIVVSVGEEFSKGSARSISGINIVEIIREHAEMLVAHGGHSGAAGFTIKTSKLELFQKRINKTAKKLLTDEILNRKLKIDCELDFNLINWELTKKIKEFEPSGNGNSTPTFATFGVKIIDIKVLGKDKNHLKLKLSKENKFLDAIGFGMAKDFPDLGKGDLIDAAYNIDENEWNGVKSLQLRIKDIIKMSF
ncbi:single-stranded-DNA-specific exonuclease RecJ [soil metagenome]